jgi:hypothetical protein
MPGDSFFDSNKDGKLTGFETVMRDAHHLEMMNKANQEAKAKSENNTPLYHHNDTAYNPAPIADDKKEQPKQQTDSGSTILACGLVILFVIIAFAIVLNTENDFIRGYRLGQREFDLIVEYGNKNKVKFNQAEFDKTKKWLQISIKALIGERLFTRSTYYRIMNDSDSMIGEEFRTALKTFEN